MSDFEMHSILTCPKCGHVESEEIPTTRHQRYYACKSCSIVIVPRPGDCCVFCSYGSNPCLSVQEKRNHDDDLSDVITTGLTEKTLCPPLKRSRE